MPKAYEWTLENLRYLRDNVAAGVSYDAIGEHLGLTRNTCIEKARKFPEALVARKELRERIAAMTRCQRDMTPLPAGHPVSWLTITAGTILEGSPYQGTSE